MSSKELEIKLHDLKDMLRMAEELSGMIENAKDELKRQMEEQAKEMETKEFVATAGGGTGRGYAVCRGLQSHLEGRHQQPHRHRRPEAGSPGTGPALHPDQHDPALRIGMKKAPNVTATRRGHPVHRHPGGYMNIISWPAR